MGILSRLFGGGAHPESATSGDLPIECRHSQLVPRWDSAEDMGKADKASEYVCSSCGEHFTPDRAHEMRGY